MKKKQWKQQAKLWEHAYKGQKADLSYFMQVAEDRGTDNEQDFLTIEKLKARIAELETEAAALQSRISQLENERNCYYTQAAEFKALSDERWEPLDDGFINCSFGDVESQVCIQNNGALLRARSGKAVVDLAFGGLRICRKVEAAEDGVNA